MISLESLVSVIQDSVLSASHAINNNNIELLDLYFEQADGSEALDDLVQRSITSAAAAENASDSDAAQAALQQAAQSLEAAANMASGTGNKTVNCLRPKTVTMEYPHVTAEGPSVHLVHVPLITLAPMSMSEISEVTFKTDLEVLVSDDDKMHVSFKKNKTSTENDSLDTTESEGYSATLEVVVKATEPADGLKKVVEGYERALRAQIPG